MQKLLIIEDDKLIANIYRNKFTVEGFNVETAADGQEGLELIQAFKPDLVILDLMLPKMTGVEVLTAIRSLPGCQKLPVIVFSNTYLSNSVQEAWKAGATKCLSKASCSPAQLVKLVQSTSAASTRALSVVDPASAAAPSDEITKEIPDDADQAELRQAFVEGLLATLNTLRTQLQGMVKCRNEAERQQLVDGLCRKVHAVTGNAAIAGMRQIAHFSDALEALLMELSDKPKNINASTLRTVANAVDFLGVLFEPGNLTNQPEIALANILVVDDEELSRRAVMHALERVKLRTTGENDPQAA